MANIAGYHAVSPLDMLPDWQSRLEDSVSANGEILRRELAEIGAEAFDFCFVDGDHQEASFLRDLEIARALSRPPYFALLDDTKEELHETARVYRQQVRPKVAHHDFNDWPVFVSCSLVWYDS